MYTNTSTARSSRQSLQQSRPPTTTAHRLIHNTCALIARSLYTWSTPPAVLTIHTISNTCTSGDPYACRKGTCLPCEN